MNLEKKELKSDITAMTKTSKRHTHDWMFHGPSQFIPHEFIWKKTQENRNIGKTSAIYENQWNQILYSENIFKCV